MSRTFAHKPTKFRPYGENIDNLANVPTDGSSDHVRCVTRSCCDELVSAAAAHRRGLIQTLSTIRSLSDAEECFPAVRSFNPKG